MAWITEGRCARRGAEVLCHSTAFIPLLSVRMQILAMYKAKVNGRTPWRLRQGDVVAVPLEG